MNQDTNAIWQEIMENWQAGQQTMAEQMLAGFQQWNDAINSNSVMKSNPVLDSYRAFTDNVLKNYSSLNKSGFTQDWEKYLSNIPGSESLSSDIKQLMNNGQQLFEQMSGQFMSALKDDESHRYLLKALVDMSTPNSWLKYSGDTFDLGAHKLSEGPMFSGINDIDKRMAQVTDSWMDLYNHSREYHAIVFGRWINAYSRFLDELRNLSEEQQADLSPRKLIDHWSSIANEELMKLHRSEEFLTAQRAVIRASMQYRLHEKNVAEVICEALHIPTRDEVDELHKTVTELRRELRQTKSALQTLSHKQTTTRRKQTTKKKTVTGE